MKLLFFSIGTRGDMEPFVAIGEMLKARGHSITFAFPGQFKDLAVSGRFAFHSLGQEYIDMLESDAGKAAMGGTGTGLKKLARCLDALMNEQSYRERAKEISVQMQQEDYSNELCDMITG